MPNNGWIGVDLDGTLAEYDGWKGIEHIGRPIPYMLQRVEEWLKQGTTVKIFTARYGEGEEQIRIIQDWLESIGLPRLEVTATKDFNMIECWDDRSVQIVPNTGIAAVKQVADDMKMRNSYDKHIENQTPIIEKTPKQKMDDLSKMMIMMRSDIIGTVESIKKHPYLSVHLLPNKSKLYNAGVNDSVKAIHYYYQGVFAKAVEYIVKAEKESSGSTEEVATEHDGSQTQKS